MTIWVANCPDVRNVVVGYQNSPCWANGVVVFNPDPCLPAPHDSVANQSHATGITHLHAERIQICCMAILNGQVVDIPGNGIKAVAAPIARPTVRKLNATNGSSRSSRHLEGHALHLLD